MDKIQKMKESLQLFNQKVERLNELSFTDRVKTVKTGITISSKRNDDGLFTTTVERRGPSQESVEAFVLTFRLFLQDNDAISIRNLAEHYSAGILDSDLENQFSEIRKELTHYLDSPDAFRFIEKDKALSRREIMDMYLYGDLAHMNRHHRNKHAYWTSSEMLAKASFHEFVVIISNVLKALWWIRDLNEDALRELNSPI